MKIIAVSGLEKTYKTTTLRMVCCECLKARHYKQVDYIITGGKDFQAILQCVRPVTGKIIHIAIGSQGDYPDNSDQHVDYAQGNNKRKIICDILILACHTSRANNYKRIVSLSKPNHELVIASTSYVKNSGYTPFTNITNINKINRNYIISLLDLAML